MKRFIALSCCLILISASIFAQNINGRFSSSIYTFQRYDSASSSNNYLRSFQLFNLNINKDNVSLRSYMNLESDLMTKLDGDPKMRFYNLYLEVRDLFKIATIKLGRQPIFNSVAGGVYDGVNLDMKKGDYSLNAYYGGDVPAYQKLQLTSDWKDNFILGGKFTTVALKNFQVALSYVNKNFKPDSYWATRLDANLNPIKVLIENNSNQYQFASAEVNYDLQNKLSVNTKYDYDLNFNQTSKFEIDGNYSPSDKWKLDLYYNFRNPIIRYNSIFSVFDYGNTQEVEAGADYIINKSITLTGRYGNVIYKDDNSQRVTLGINTNYGSVSYRKTFGYEGELDALSLYWAYSYLQGVVTPSFGVSYTTYKLSEADNENELVSVLSGVNVRPWNALSFDLQAQYMNNKIYQDDLRFFLKLNYWFNTNF
ncbi:MAG: hypothetical protein M1480_11540 [Bacteroidetes bacterium]|nr:hypothetical protein [Bacteroidota bacterium]